MTLTSTSEISVDRSFLLLFTYFGLEVHRGQGQSRPTSIGAKAALLLWKRGYQRSNKLGDKKGSKFFQTYMY